MSTAPDSSIPNNFSQTQYLNTTIRIAAIVIIVLVALFILIIHLLLQWFWRRSYSVRSPSRTSASWRRRQLAGSAGLDKAIIDSLPTFVYQAPAATEEAVLECAVCLCEFEEKETGRLLPKCNHSFHTDCIDMWFFSHSTCPLCRTIVTPPESLPDEQQIASAQASTSSSPLSQAPEESRTLEIGLQTSEAVVISTASLLGTEDNGLFSPEPQTGIDIQSRAGILLSSLSLPRSSSTGEQSSPSPREQQLKLSSTHLKNSIKRILSRERRVFPSEGESDELEQDEIVSPV